MLCIAFYKVGQDMDYVTVEIRKDLMSSTHKKASHFDCGMESSSAWVCLPLLPVTPARKGKQALNYNSIQFSK